MDLKKIEKLSKYPKYAQLEDDSYIYHNQNEEKNKQQQKTKNKQKL